MQPRVPPPLPPRLLSSPPSATPTQLHPPPPSHPQLHQQQQSWSPGQSFYFRGSAAPPIISHHRNTPPPPPQFQQQQQQQQQQHGPLSEGRCSCCDAELRYPAASMSFRCTLCGAITDMRKKTGLAAAAMARVVDGPGQATMPPPKITPVSEEEILSLASRLRNVNPSQSNPFSTSPPSFASLSLSSSTPSTSDESILISYITSAFRNLESINTSFRRVASPSPPPLPSYSTLTTFYDLVKVRPEALETLKSSVEGVLKRPGPSLWEGDGGWLTVLLECPILWSDYTPDSARRNWIVSRLLGLISNLPNELHHSLVATYLCSTSPLYPRHALLSKIELVVSFVSSRIGSSMHSNEPCGYTSDWGVKAGSKVGALLFAANLQQPRLPISAFYCTLVDSLGHSAMVQAFLQWEGRDGRFTLCQYPFLLSLGVKIHLLTYDGQRQMLDKAREALRNSYQYRQLQTPFLQLTVRRTQLVNDSLQQISTNRHNLKKSLKITFDSEDGIDAGGLRKEWMLLLVRELFDPKWGMFSYDDEESGLCWLNPASFDLDEFDLVGVVVGLAVFNSITLDVPLPLAIYKKLLSEPVSLSDLSSIQPSLARGLQSLLDHPDDDVEDVFCRTFVGEYESFGEVVQVPLVPGGERIPVTNANRVDFVRRFVDFILTSSISQQYEAFARGFNMATGGNALSLFKGEELELCVRGSKEPLDVEQLKGVTVYEGFEEGEEDETVELFWQVFTSMNPTRQRQLLSFITGSDRIPATGTAALQLKLTCMGNDARRYPQSHTCFNQLCLFRYPDRETMEERLTRAMEESEGFGLK